MTYEQRFEIVKKKIQEKLAEQGKRDTDENVSQFLGISKPTYNRWKNEGKIPDASKLIYISEQLNISIDWLLLGKGEMLLSAQKTEQPNELAYLRQRVLDLEGRIKDKDELLSTLRGLSAELVLKRDNASDAINPALGASGAAPISRQDSE